MITPGQSATVELMKLFNTRDDLLSMIPTHGIIAELGVFKGDFSARLLDICEPRELHLIDKWQGFTTSADQDGRNGVALRDAITAYETLRERYADDERIWLHRAQTAKIAEFPAGYFDFVYVDADHSYDGCLQDLLNSAEKVKQCGFLGGHDYDSPYWDLAGVTRAVNNFLRWHSEWQMVARTLKDGCPSFLLQRIQADLTAKPPQAHTSRPELP